MKPNAKGHPTIEMGSINFIVEVKTSILQQNVVRKGKIQFDRKAYFESQTHVYIGNI